MRGWIETCKVDRIPPLIPHSDELCFSALEITTKLCDPEFTRKAKAADFFSRTWDLLLEAGDDKVNCGT